MKEETVEIKMKIESSDNDVDDSMCGIYGSFDCPKCEKGIITVGVVREIIFPAGLLCAEKYGEQRFYHYTCDRCGFKILVQDESDIKHHDDTKEDLTWLLDELKYVYNDMNINITSFDDQNGRDKLIELTKKYEDK